MTSIPNNSFQPLVSLIMPVYRTPLDLLERAGDSVLRQTYANYELLIVDDGSGDEYVETLRQLGEKDLRFKLLLAPHGGASAARNYGIEHAQGECIMFLDSDDELISDCIEHAVRYLTSENLDIVCGSVEYVYAGHSDLKKPFCGLDTELYTIVDEDIVPLKSYFFANEMVSALPLITGLQRGPVAKLFTRHVIGQVRFEPAFTMYEDSTFLSFVFGNAQRVGLVNDRWYIYHQNTNSIVHSFTLDDSFDSHIAALKRVASENNIGANAYRAHIAHYFFEALEEGVMAGNDVRLSTVKAKLSKPYCRDAFSEVDNDEFRFTSKRRMMHWLAKRNAAIPIYGLYRLRKALWNAKGHTAVDS